MDITLVLTASLFIHLMQQYVPIKCHVFNQSKVKGKQKAFIVT